MGKSKAELAGGGFGGRFGGFAMLTDNADEGLRSAGEAAVAAIDETEFAPKVHTFDGEQLDFAGFHVILRKTLTDDGNAGIGGDKALDHADAGQLHGDVNARAIGAEKLVEHLAGETSARENKRLLSDFGEGDLGAMSERVLGADHEAQAILINVVHFQVGRLDGQGDDADVDGAVLDALENFVAEVAIDADMHQRIAALKFCENVGEQIEAGRFIGAENDGALNHIAAVGNDLNGFVTQAEELFRVLEENFTGGSQLDRFGGTVKEAGFIGLLKLANLRADSGLRAENLLARARKTLEFGDKDKSSELVEVHNQNARQRL
jgi:hypothetical protein